MERSGTCLSSVFGIQTDSIESTHYIFQKQLTFISRTIAARGQLKSDDYTHELGRKFSLQVFIENASVEGTIRASSSGNHIQSIHELHKIRSFHESENMAFLRRPFCSAISARFHDIAQSGRPTSLSPQAFHRFWQSMACLTDLETRRLHLKTASTRAKRSFSRESVSRPYHHCIGTCDFLLEVTTPPRRSCLRPWPRAHRTPTFRARGARDPRRRALSPRRCAQDIRRAGHVRARHVTHALRTSRRA